MADRPELLAMQSECLDQRTERADRHAEVADVGVGGVLPAEGNADATEDGDATAMQHVATSGTSPSNAAGIMRQSLRRACCRSNHAGQA